MVANHEGQYPAQADPPGFARVTATSTFNYAQDTAGELLIEQAIEALLREAMRKQRVDRLFRTMEKLSTLTPALDEAEIAAEIEAARAERRNTSADRR